MNGSPLATDRPEAHPEADNLLLDEEQVRDQVAAAEQLIYLGHAYPALVAAGAAIEGALRLRCHALAGSAAARLRCTPDAKAAAHELLEALWRFGDVADIEHERLRKALVARAHLNHGFAPRDPVTATPERTQAALDIALRLLEGLPETTNKPGQPAES